MPTVGRGLGVLRGAPADGFGAVTACEPIGTAAGADGGRRPRPTPGGGGGAAPPAEPGGGNLPPPVGGPGFNALSPLAVDEMVARLNGIGDAGRGAELLGLDGHAERGVEKAGCIFG